MDRGFYEAADPRPNPEDVRAAMLEVDLIALRLRVAAAKADVQLRMAWCALFEERTRARLLSREAREEQRDHLEGLRTSVSRFANLLHTTGAPREQVSHLVEETVNVVTGRGLESASVRAIVSDVLQLFGHSPAA